MTSFNVGSANFTQITDLDSLERGSNYLLKMRDTGHYPRIDYIGTYRGLMDGIDFVFKLIYYRIPRLYDTAPYNPWVAYTNPQNSGGSFDHYTNGHIFIRGTFRVDGSTIYSLGPVGNMISEEKTPDEVTEETISAAHNVTFRHGVVGPGGHILDYLPGPHGGKSKRSSRRKKKSTRKKKNMKKRSKKK